MNFPMAASAISLAYDRYVDRPLIQMLSPAALQLERLSTKAWPIGRVLLLVPMALCMKYHAFEMAALLLLLFHVADRLHTALRPSGLFAFNPSRRSDIGRLRYTMAMLGGKTAMILSLWSVLLTSNAPVLQSLLLWAVGLAVIVWEGAHASALVVEYVDMAAAQQAGDEDSEAARRAQPAIETNARHAMEFTATALIMIAQRSSSPFTTLVGALGLLLLGLSFAMAVRSLQVITAKVTRSDEDKAAVLDPMGASPAAIASTKPTKFTSGVAETRPVAPSR